MGRDPPLRAARGQPRAAPHLSDAPNAVRPAAAPARARDDDGARRECSSRSSRASASRSPGCAPICCSRPASSIWSLSTVAFAIIPALGSGSLDRADAWAALAGSIAGQGLIAVAPFVGGRSRLRDRAIRDAVLAAAVALAAVWLLLPRPRQRAAGADRVARRAPRRPASPRYSRCRRSSTCSRSSAGDGGSRRRATTWRSGSRSASRSSSSRRSTSSSRRRAARTTSPRATTCACSRSP